MTSFQRPTKITEVLEELSPPVHGIYIHTEMTASEMTERSIKQRSIRYKFLLHGTVFGKIELNLRLQVLTSLNQI
jgi:hypothetical protein